MEKEKNVKLNAGTIHSLVRNELIRKGIPWIGSVRVNHEGREMSLNLTNHVTQGDHKDCITWTFDTLGYEPATRLLASATKLFFDEELDPEKLHLKHLDQSKAIFLEVRITKIKH